MCCATRLRGGTEVRYRTMCLLLFVLCQRDRVAFVQGGCSMLNCVSSGALSCEVITFYFPQRMVSSTFAQDVFYYNM